MKKRKTYEISIIDKTYSKTISDETKFYTSDTALELEFKLKETEYTFESAEIVLLNIDDRSLVTRPVSKVNNDFVYELDDDITAHYGEWHGQLRFEAGETYVSSPVKFRVENDFGNERPPQLSDVQSWVSLKRYADGLVDELKQAVLSVEGIEDTFNENETERQTTFEMAESQRQSTFESNETTRQSQELEREKAEATRQTVFGENEASRTETFNANDAARQENESARQQAEQERLSAEQGRVDNEEQRVLNFENMQETIDMIGKKKLVNLTENGNFAEGLVGWTNSRLQSTLSIENDMLKVSYITQVNNLYVGNEIKFEYKDHIYYSIARFNPVNLKGTVRLLHSGAYRHTQTIEKQNELQTISAIFNGSGTGNQTEFRAFTTDTKAGDYFYIDYFMMFDLTDIFGAGKEPSKEIMDWIISENGYFEELKLKRDDIQQYEINQLRKAVIALGGTI